MCIIPKYTNSFYFTSLPQILYVGHDLSLLEFLRNIVAVCRITRCPIGSIARLFIRDINYSLILLDEELPDANGLELAHFARSLKYHEQTPIIVLSDMEYDVEVILCKPNDFQLVARAIMYLLDIQLGRKEKGSSNHFHR